VSIAGAGRIGIRNKPAGNFKVATTKRTKVQSGDVIWVISGEKSKGKKRHEYRLEYWFFIEEREASEQSSQQRSDSKKPVFHIHGARGARLSGVFCSTLSNGSNRFARRRRTFGVGCNGSKNLC